MDARRMAAWAALKALRRLCAAGSAGATAPPRLSSDVIFELVLRRLETNEQFEAGALHRRLDLGQAQRVDRRVGIPGLALARDAVLDIGRQRRRGGVDIGRRLAKLGRAHVGT